MILFILEGKKQEPRIYKTIQQIYFRNRIEDEIIVSYCSNIFSLFNKMKEYDSLWAVREGLGGRSGGWLAVESIIGHGL